MSYFSLRANFANKICLNKKNLNKFKKKLESELETSKSRLELVATCGAYLARRL